MELEIMTMQFQYLQLCHEVQQFLASIIESTRNSFYTSLAFRFDWLNVSISDCLIKIYSTLFEIPAL